MLTVDITLAKRIILVKDCFSITMIGLVIQENFVHGSWCITSRLQPTPLL